MKTILRLAPRRRRDADATLKSIYKRKHADAPYLEMEVLCVINKGIANQYYEFVDILL